MTKDHTAGRGQREDWISRMWILFWCSGMLLISPPFSPPHATPGWLENLGTFHFDIWNVGKEDSWSLSFSIRMVKKIPFPHIPQDALCEFSIYKVFMDRVRQKKPFLLLNWKGIKPGDKSWGVVNAVLPWAWFWSWRLLSWILLCVPTIVICPVRSWSTARYNWPVTRLGSGHQGS